MTTPDLAAAVERVTYETASGERFAEAGCTRATCAQCDPTDLRLILSALADSQARVAELEGARYEWVDITDAELLAELQRLADAPDDIMHLTWDDESTLEAINNIGRRAAALTWSREDG